MLKTAKQAINKIVWHLTGQNLPVHTQAPYPLAVPTNDVPDVTQPYININDVIRMVLVDLLVQPVQYFKVLDQCGRVALVSFMPYGKHDPVMPVPLINLGQPFKAHYQQMAFALAGWVNDMFALPAKVASFNRLNARQQMAVTLRSPDTSGYFSEMQFGCENAIKCARLSNEWTNDEWQYFVYQMRLSCARPDRFTDYDPPEWKAKWSEAVRANVAVRQAGL